MHRIDTTEGKVALALAVLFLLFHLFLSFGIIFVNLFRNEQFADQLRRVFGLIRVEIDSKDSKRVKVSKMFARCYLVIKVFDKFVVVILVTFLSSDPKFILYLFVIAIFMSLVINFSGIF